MASASSLSLSSIDEVSLVAGEGFEPSKAEPGDLQSPPIGRSGNPPYELLAENFFSAAVMLAYGNKGGTWRPIPLMSTIPKALSSHRIP